MICFQQGALGVREAVFGLGRIPYPTVDILLLVAIILYSSLNMKS